MRAKMFAVRVLWDGGRGNHDISRDAAPIGSKSNKVGTLELFVSSANELLRGQCASRHVDTAGSTDRASDCDFGLLVLVHKWLDGSWMSQAVGHRLCR